MSTLYYRTQQVGDVEVFYRGAGQADAPVMLLYGFPTSGHVFCNFIPELSKATASLRPTARFWADKSALARHVRL